MITEQAFAIGNDSRIQVSPWLWVMDNHKWALVAWEQYRKSRDQRYDLVHVDYHWDGVNDFYGKTAETDRLRYIGLAEIERLVGEDLLITLDSFIAPAIIRGYIENLHFVCFQGDECGDEGIDEETLQLGRTKQFKHSSPSGIVRTGNPLIFDFCLDVFNRSDKWFTSDYWSEDAINSFLEECKPLVLSAVVVTFSISYGYSGTEEDAKKLARKVLDKFMAWRE